MQLFKHPRSLHMYVLLWLITPFLILLVIAVVTTLAVFQNSLKQLVLERHQQLANLAAVTVSERIERGAHILEVLSARPALRDPSLELRETAFRQSAGDLDDFTGGVVQVNTQGVVITAAPGRPLAQWDELPDTRFLNQLSLANGPIFSDVIVIDHEKEAILIAVPTFTEAGEFSGAVIGAIDINSPGNAINTVIQKLTTSTPGIAYLLDDQGVVISHPDPAEIGKTYADPLSFEQTVRGSKGGSLWVTSQGKRFAGAEAIVTPSGWRLIVEESWEAITAPVRRYTYLFIFFILLALVMFFFLSWFVTRQVTAPIQKLSNSTRLLASAEVIIPPDKSRIQEIDELRAAFTSMAKQISSYRNGLRHYVDGITRSQEEERSRIARELHDETVQNMLAVYRRMELMSASETDPQKQQQLGNLQEMVEQTLQGVRFISQDLRPFILDDLGFVPAVQMLVRKAHEGQGAVPHVNLRVEGDVLPISSGVELALYRIVQEALNNVRRHARATSVQVAVQYQPATIHLTIEDDGIGFAVPSSLTELAQAGHFGLMGMQERVWAFGGTLQVESHADLGTAITVSIPLLQTGEGMNSPGNPAGRRL